MRKKVEQIRQWIDPKEWTTVHLRDAQDLNAAVTGYDAALMDLSLETRVHHVRQRVSVRLSRTEVSEDLPHHTYPGFGLTAEASPTDAAR